jgi:glyoxylase-like metal-dependent hydrolase (beta-lactamase superfamily II)
MSGDLQWKIGAVTITTVIERHTEMPAELFAASATPDALARHAEWLKPWAMGDDGQLRFCIQAICLEAESKKIMVDTCIGPRQLPDAYGDIANDGSFINVLAAAGFGPDDVNLVICTHLHFDHVGWNTVMKDGKWVPTFPRARYLIGRQEFEHWKSASEEDKAAKAVYNLGDAVTPLFEAGLVDLVDTDHQVNGSIRFIPTPGHTPGHFSVRVTSQGESAIVTGDCAHHPVQLAETDWFTPFDWDPELTASTRKDFIAEYADKPVLIIGTHFRPPTAGHLVTEGDGAIRFRPLQ